MFSNFRKAFITQPQFTAKTPKVIIEKASKDLPDGFWYEEDPDHPGTLRITSDRDMVLDMSSAKLPAYLSEIFPGKESVTLAELQNYCYNSQQNIEIPPDANGKYMINGVEIDHNQIVCEPLKNTKFSNGRLFVHPSAFPPPHPIKIKGEGETITVMVKRQSSNSASIQRYCSVDDSGLKLEYSLDPTKPEGTMKMNLSTTHVSSASKMLAARKMINAAISGKCTVADMPITVEPSKIEKRISEEAIKFFTKAVAIENELLVHFDMTEEIDTDDVKWMDKFYRCFVEKKPYRGYKDNVTFQGTGRFSKNAAEQCIGQEFLIELTQKYGIEFCGVKLDLIVLVRTYDGIISDIEIPGENANAQFTIKLVSATGKKLYCSYMFFRNDSDLERFKSNNDSDAIMKLAEEIRH